MIAFVYQCLNDLTGLVLVSSVSNSRVETYAKYRKCHFSNICGNITPQELIFTCVIVEIFLFTKCCCMLTGNLHWYALNTKTAVFNFTRSTNFNACDK